MDWLLNISDLTQNEFFILVLITYLAGVVRGFSGFALSAMVMATAVIILPPIALIPMLWWLEMAASLLMIKNGFKEADRPMTYALVIGNIIGWPIGLNLTMALPVDTSKALALTIIVILAASQLAKVKLNFLASKPGLYGTGVVAGIVSGISHTGAMVIAFYVLAADKSAHVMRASLVLFLFLGSLSSMIILLFFGVMDFSGATRGLVFALPTMIGVVVGQKLFTERLAPYYRPVCLILLIGLASIGLIRTVVMG